MSEERQISWKTIISARRRIFKYLLVLPIFFVCEIAISYVLTLFLSEDIYLSWYLTDEAIKSTEKFLSDRHEYLIPSPELGWENRPNTKKGNWIIDEYGSRSSTLIGAKSKKKYRAIFLGSSTMNGGVYVKNNETISAYAENENIESLNFGTMLYSMDQIFLQYKSKVQEFKPNIIVCGLDNFIDKALLNIYIPFLIKKEVNMPFVKPRYKLVGNELVHIKVNPYKLLANIERNPEAVRFFKNNDGFYDEFRAYQLFGIFPISMLASTLFDKYKYVESYFLGDKNAKVLRERIIEELVREAKKRNTRIVLLKFVTKRLYGRNGVYRFLPDTHQECLKRLIKYKQDQMVDVVDSRELFRQRNLKSFEIFAEDGVHYLPKANKAVAETLSALIDQDIL